MRITTLCLLALTLTITACIPTARVTEKYSLGVAMKPTDVVLFTGIDDQNSRSAQEFFTMTRDRLAKCGIKVLYLHDKDLPLKLIEMNFPSTAIDVDNDVFIDQMKQAYGLNYIFSVGQGSTWDNENLLVGIDERNKAAEITFYVYSVEFEQLLSTMVLKGTHSSIGAGRNRFGEERFLNLGSVDGATRTAYRKGLNKIMKSSLMCN